MSTTGTLITMTLGLAVGVFACGGPQHTQMTASSLVPAAQGHVESEMGENGNTNLRIQVSHLAHPGMLQDGATTYVVWIQPSGQTVPQNLGALKIGKDLTGLLKTSTPHEEFQLSITAEPFPQAADPAGPLVFRTVVRSSK